MLAVQGLFLQWIILVLIFPNNSVAVELTIANYTGIQTGQPFTLTWDGASGNVSLALYYGAANALRFFSTIATDVTGTNYTWIPASNIPSGLYVFDITDNTGITDNFSVQFTLTNNSPTSATSSSQTSSSSSSTSTSSPTVLQLSQNSSSGSRAGLTTGAKIGVGIGASIGGTLLIGIVAFFFYHQGRRHATERKTLEEDEDGFPRKAELGTGEMGEISPITVDEKVELEGKRRSAELDGLEIPVEIGGNERSELEA